MHLEVKIDSPTGHGNHVFRVSREEETGDYKIASRGFHICADRSSIERFRDTLTDILAATKRGAMTYEDVDRDYPTHCRTSCSDKQRDNRDPDGSGCIRCNALEFAELDELRTVGAHNNPRK